MDIILTLLGFACLIFGVLGCLLPILPGPPIAYVGLLILNITTKVQFSTELLLFWLFLVVIIQVLDYFIPMLGSKFSGGSKWGNWGCALGTIAGMFFLPWGVIMGPFLGAVIGELLGRKEFLQAIKSGLASLLGFFLGTIIKLLLCFYFIYQFCVSG